MDISDRIRLIISFTFILLLKLLFLAVVTLEVKNPPRLQIVKMAMAQNTAMSVRGMSR
ncbi:MAG: hypothetical protein ACE3JP_17080 [Ectobacillus sp.]